MFIWGKKLLKMNLKNSKSEDTHPYIYVLTKISLLSWPHFVLFVSLTKHNRELD